MTGDFFLFSRTAVACCPDVAMDEIKRTVGTRNNIDGTGVKVRNYGEAAVFISVSLPFEYLVHEHVIKLLKS